ncbi:siderophore ABC transporter substrate-binding protein [Arthrobacter mobilis]|uniref:Siderophore ABC transporter substrate-binding protein n=1 Tax=Arthrobacter mobilis TaxID=2724944 RepID=A0A7X6HDL0_9MICC|nr:siderophore ABC transporter substrate-binding protein [Arthrobacter mobilis]NKX53687.1 siderophore ABC transporter substrate-binding protein [Arthrobacter mobilis]
MNTTVKSRLLAASAAFSLLALSACGQEAGASAAAAGETVTIEHAQGSTAVPVNPETVYSFDLGVLDSLDALGLEADGVPEAVFPESLSKYEDGKYTKIGSMKEPDFEAISAGAPDLIIISGRTAGAYEELSKIAPTIDLSIDQARALESFTGQAENLGRIFEAEDLVSEKLAAIDAQIEETRAKAADAGKGLILLTSGGEVTAYGAGSRFGLVHDVLGVPTAAEVKADGAHGESVSFEFVKETNPDLLFVVDRDAAMGTEGEAAAAVLDNDLVKSTNAVRNGRIVPLDATSWYNVGYGLNNLPAMVGDVEAAL